MSYQQVLLRTELAGEPVSRFMRPDPVMVRRDVSIRELVEQYLYRFDMRLFPVVDERGDLMGCVTTEDLETVPKEDWAQHTVSEIMKPCSDDNTVGPNDDAL
jgi:predicted transcriptional regulator